MDSRQPPVLQLILLTPLFPPDIGGPATYVESVAHSFKEETELSIIGFCEGKAAPIPGVKIKLVNPYELSFLGRQRWLWKTLQKTLKPQTFLYIQGPLVVGLVGVLFARWHRIPHALKFVGDLAWENASRYGKTHLNLEDWLKSRHKGFRPHLLYLIQKWNLHAAARILVPSQFLKDVLVQHYHLPAVKVQVLYNAYEGELTTHAVQAQAHRLMSAGRLVPHKNMQGIMEALKQLPEAFTLDIYGSGPEEEGLKNWTHHHGLDKRIRFHGHVTRETLLKALDQHDLFILYSDYEGLPHSLLEAAARACPILASDIPGTREVALAGLTAELCPPQNPTQLAKAIQRLSKDQKYRSLLVKNAQEKLHTPFSWTAHRKGLEGLFFNR